jgi:4-hydroxybenzoate polyprenyltransferase
MDIGFLLFALFMIFFAVAMMLVYRAPKGMKYQYVGAWSSAILIGLAILLRGYDVIPAIAGWTLVAIAILLFWTLFYDMFFRRKKK